MPSPVGHALAAVAAGWVVARPEPRDRPLVTQVAILSAIGAAPDLDLLIGRHRAETHSLGAALIVAAVAAWWRWPIASTRVRIFAAACLAYATHPLLDMLANDTSVPFGVMAWWPFSHGYYLTPWPVFLPIFRNWWQASFYWTNSLAAVREIAILGPLVVLVGWLRRPRSVPESITSPVFTASSRSIQSPRGTQR